MCRHSSNCGQRQCCTCALRCVYWPQNSNNNLLTRPKAAIILISDAWFFFFFFFQTICSLADPFGKWNLEEEMASAPANQQHRTIFLAQTPLCLFSSLNSRIWAFLSQIWLLSQVILWFFFFFTLLDILVRLIFDNLSRQGHTRWEKHDVFRSVLGCKRVGTVPMKAQTKSSSSR